MPTTTTMYVIAGVSAALSLIAWTAWVLVPAWSAYSRIWERLLAALLSVYVLAAFVLLGGGLGAAVLWYYDEL